MPRKLLVLLIKHRSCFLIWEIQKNMNFGESRKLFFTQHRILVVTKWYLNCIDSRTNLISLLLSIWATKEKEVQQQTNLLRRDMITFSYCPVASNNLTKNSINSLKVEMYLNQKDKSLKRNRRRRKIRVIKLEQDNSKRKWINSEKQYFVLFFCAKIGLFFWK